jgi:cytidine deaminase
LTSTFGILEQAINSALGWREHAILVKPSQTKVGASVFTNTGRIYSGFNIQNKAQKSYHAEEVACINAMINGVKGENIAGIVVTFSDTDISKLTFCCDSCRQVLWEYTKNPNLNVYEVGLDGKIVSMKKFSELYPYPYPVYQDGSNINIDN